jgi:hypothetical protein
VIGLLHQSLALGARQGTPVAQLQLYASEIQLAAHGHGNAAQIAGATAGAALSSRNKLRHNGLAFSGIPT